MLKFFLVLGSTFALDVITKMEIRTRLPLGAEIPVLPFFSIVHVTNTGVAFGMFQNNNGLFASVGLLMITTLTVYALKLRAREPAAGLIMAMIVGGAAGNLLDRFFYGRVTDFLDFYVGPHHWPAFNVGDSAICVGAALLFANELRAKSR